MHSAKTSRSIFVLLMVVAILLHSSCAGATVTHPADRRGLARGVLEPAEAEALSSPAWTEVATRFNAATHASSEVDGLGDYFLAVDRARHLIEASQGDSASKAPAWDLATSLGRLQGALEDLVAGRVPEDGLISLRGERPRLENTDAQIRQLLAETGAKPGRARRLTPVWQRQPDLVQDYSAKWSVLTAHLDDIEQLGAASERAADPVERESRRQALKAAATEALVFLQDNAPPEPDDISDFFGGVAPVTRQAPELGPPTLARRITPAYVTQATPPGPEDLAETPEVQITPEIVALVENLDNSPIQIYEYVRNNFEIEPYYGSLKGSTATLWTGAGNDYDQASLLIALLRAAGIPARYVVGTVTIPIQQVQSWLGVTDPHVAYDYLAWPDELITLRDGTLGLQMEHIWAEAYVPYSNYGGTAIDDGGQVWVPLDPSFKIKRYQEGLELPPDLEFDRDDFLSAIDRYLPSEAYQDLVWDHMRANMAGHALSEVAYRGRILPEKLGLLPTSLPYTVDAVAGEYAEVPDTMRYKAVVTMDDYQTGHSLIANAQLLLPQVAVKRVTLSYEEVSGATVRPVLRVDGQAAATGGNTTLGNYNTITVGFVYPLLGQVQVVTDYRRAGTYMALAIDAHQTGDRLLAERGARLLEAAELAGTPQEDQDDLLGELLYLAGMRYWQHCNESEASVGGLYHYVLKKYLRYGLLSSEMDVTYLFDRPFSFTARGLNLDVGLNWLTRLPIDGDESRAGEVTRLAGMDSSSLEHQIWEEVVVEDSISTIKGLQYANEQGIPIHTIDQSNIDAIMPLLTLSEGVKEIIRQHVNEGDGWTVIVHQDPITYNQWQGAVWIQENPETGNAGYWISGSLQGGSITCDPPGSCPPPEDPGTEGIPLDCLSAGGQPVTYSNGNMYHQFLDILIPGRGPALELRRTYNAQSETDGPFGYGWTHNYQTHLMIDAGTGDVTYVNSSGGKYPFTRNPDGSYSSPYGTSVALHAVSGGYELRDKFGMVAEFDDAGRLVSVTGRNGNIQTLTYTGGRLARVTDAVGRSLNFNYNAQGRINAVSDFSGRTWSYNYDGSGNLISSSTPSDDVTPAYTTRYAYYSDPPLAHNLKRITDPRGQVISFSYYQTDKIFQTVEPEGAVTTYRYSPFRRETEVINERGYMWTYSYDEHGFLTRIERPDGSLNLRIWDSAGYLTASVDPLGYTTSMTYDARGNLQSVTGPLGHTTSYEYEPTFSQVTKVTDPRNQVATFTIDPIHGNLLQITDPLGETTSYTYAAEGDLETITDAEGHTQTVSYDARGYTSAVTDGRGNTWSLTYDDLGRLTSLENPLGETTSYTYDILDRRITRTDGEGHTQTYAYDGNGNLVRWTDANGRTAEYAYDGLNNLTVITDALGNTTHLSYQAQSGSCANCAATSGGTSSGNLTAVTNANGHTRRYEYDALNRLAHEFDATGRTTSYRYDAQGNLVEVEAEDGRVTRYTYDPRGYLLSSRFPDGSTNTYTYDEMGNLLTAANAHATLTFEYDERGLISSVTDSALAKTVSYTYNGVGKRATMTDADGLTWQYAYDENNNLVSLRDFAGVVTTFSYDAADRLTRIAPAASQPGVNLAVEYDRTGRIAGLSNTSPDGSTTFLEFDYTYDDAWQVETATVSGANGFSGWLGRTAYDYDDDYRLTGVTWPDGTGQSYGYDPSGNRTRLTKSGDVPRRSYYDEADQHTYGGAEGEALYTYDSRGNVRSMTIDGQVTNYHWDDRDHLIRIEYPDGSQSSYSYDALGRRISKTLPDGSEVRYLYDGLNILQEFDGTGDPQAKYVHTLGLDHPLRMSRGGRSYYYLYDRLGSIIGLSDGADSPEASYLYDPWGNAVGGDDGEIKNPFRYTAREADAESGLYYYRARYYDPQSGRFLSRDPIDAAGILHPYAYVQNDPLNGTDPLGLLLEEGGVADRLLTYAIFYGGYYYYRAAPVVTAAMTKVEAEALLLAARGYLGAIGARAALTAAMADVGALVTRHAIVAHLMPRQYAAFVARQAATAAARALPATLTAAGAVWGLCEIYAAGYEYIRADVTIRQVVPAMSQTNHSKVMEALATIDAAEKEGTMSPDLAAHLRQRISATDPFNQ